MAKLKGNDPISHCRNGQGGYTMSMMKSGGRGNKGSEHIRLRQKIQPAPMGASRFPFGKYYDWDLDPEGYNTQLGIVRLH